MRLAADHNPGAYSVRVSCCLCGDRHLLADMVADLDGEAFKAYYCVECRKAHIAEGTPVTKCRRDGCTRCPM